MKIDGRNNNNNKKKLILKSYSLCITTTKRSYNDYNKNWVMTQYVYHHSEMFHLLDNNNNNHNEKTKVLER